MRADRENFPCQACNPDSAAFNLFCLIREVLGWYRDVFVDSCRGRDQGVAERKVKPSPHETCDQSHRELSVVVLIADGQTLQR